MDSDIKYIMEEEQKLVHLAEDSRRAARERVDLHRQRSVQLRESEFNRITIDYNNMFNIKLHEIKIKMENELKEMREMQENLLNEADLKNKITGRIVSIILENRA